MPRKRVLIVYYSYTQQTKTQLRKLVAGLENWDIEVVLERLEPHAPYEFPFRSNWRLAVAMISTFFCRTMTIRPLSANCQGRWDCIIVAGPTWSYNPSGPVLDFLRRYGPTLCAGKTVVPLISCRSYWRWHYFLLRQKLLRYGCTVGKPIVYMHPQREPWRFLGLLLQLRGKVVPRQYSWWKKRYPAYGHSREQGEQALRTGKDLGAWLSGENVRYWS